MKIFRLGLFLLVCAFFGACSPGETSAGTSPAEVGIQDVAVNLPPEDTAATDTLTIDTSNSMVKSTSTIPADTTHGVFVELQEGDYLHFVMQDAAGKRHTFWIAEDMAQEQYVPFLDGVYTAGQKVRVQSREVNRKFPESDVAEMILEAFEILVE